MHFKRTLAAFSLDGKVGIVTGGARGLGVSDEPGYGHQWC
jgi:D-arabinitol 2-dehydrogenase